MFRFPAILFGVLTALPVLAELVPLGDWPLDETRTALQRDDQLFRNCGRVLERWELSSEPPLLLDSLVLDSPPIDLLDWDGLLLVQLDDGVLEAHDLQADWSPPLWSLDLADCVTQLRRHGRWLLPVSPWMPLLDLENPRQPVVAQEQLGGGWDNFGGYDAVFVGDTLLGDYSDCCGSCWDVFMDHRWLVLPDTVPQGPAQSVGWIPGLSWDYDSELAAANHLLLINTWTGLQVLDPATWTVYQTLPSPGWPGEVTMEGIIDENFALISGPAGTVSLQVSHQLDEPVLPLDTLACQASRQLRLQGDSALLVSDDEVNWASLEDPAQLELTRTLGSAGGIRSQAWAGERLLVRGTRLDILSSSDGGWTLNSSLPLGDGRLLSAKGSLAVADVPGGVAVIDLAGPSPLVADIIPTPPVERLLVLEQVAVWLSGDTLVFTDLRVPTQPREIARLACPGATALDGTSSVVVAGDNGALRLFSVTPEAVVERGAMTAEFSSLAMTDPFLVTARIINPWVDPTLILQLWNVGDPANPTLAGEVINYSVDSFTLRGGEARLGILKRDYWPGWDPYNRLHLDLYDVVGDSSLVRTASLDCEERAVASFSLSRDVDSSGRLAVHVAECGLELFQDSSVTEVNPAEPHPTAFTLAAAPNPFNPVTRLSFTLERPGAARLAVFDLLGREVSLLREGTLPAGAHSILFDASALASGIYFARLEAEGRTAVEKLALVK